MRLTKNFTLYELTYSCTAARLCLDNTPTTVQVRNLRTLAEEVLQPLRDLIGLPIVVSSGFRCRELNDQIGGADKSQHLMGMAADITIPGFSNIEIYDTIRQHLEYDQVILEHVPDHSPTKGWVHVSFASKENNRKQSLEIR